MTGWPDAAPPSPGDILQSPLSLQTFSLSRGGSDLPPFGQFAAENRHVVPGSVRPGARAARAARARTLGGAAERVRRAPRARFRRARPDAWHARRLAAIDAASSGDARGADRAHLVYGEMQLEALARLLDAAGVRSSGEAFVDVGAGDGLVVLAAALLFAEELEASVGLEIVPGLVARAREHRARVLARAPRAAPTAFVEACTPRPATRPRREVRRAPSGEHARAVLSDDVVAAGRAPRAAAAERRARPRDAEGRARHHRRRATVRGARLAMGRRAARENADVAPHSTAQAVHA